MTVEGIKEEIKLQIEIFKFALIALIALLATIGGILTLLNVEKQTTIQHSLLLLGTIITIVILLGIVGLIIYIYSLLKKI